VYHKATISRGIPGTLGKVREELEEAEDAVEQGSHILLAVELSDIFLALRQVARGYGWTQEDLSSMADITERVFESGHRGGLPLSAHHQLPNPGRCREIVALLSAMDFGAKRWKTFGTGYAVARFGEHHKLHIWHPEFADSHTDFGGIHSHAYHLESTVLHGAMRTRIWGKDPSGPPEHWKLCCGSGEEFVGAVVRAEFEVGEGYTYAQTQGSFHDVVGPIQAVTWVCKNSKDGEAWFIHKGRPNPYLNPRDLTRQQEAVAREMWGKALVRWST